MRYFATIYAWALLGAWCLTALVGCGSSEYNKLMANRVGQLRAGAPFRVLWGPTQIADTPISIRVPLIFRKSYQEDSAHPDDGPKIRPDRVQPPFLQLPGLKLCYEGTVADAAGNRLPYYCYLAAVPAKSGDAAKLATELQAQLKDKFKETPDEWDAIDAKTPEDKSAQWKRLRVTAEQPFLVKSTDKTNVANSPGIFELWLHDAQDYIVLVAWRAPVSIEGPAPAPLTDVAKAAGVQLSSEVKPDLTMLPALTAGSITVEVAPGAAVAAGQ